MIILVDKRFRKYTEYEQKQQQKSNIRDFSFVTFNCLNKII